MEMEIHGNLNKIRYEVNNSMEYPKDAMKKILLFITVINDRIKVLKRKSVYSNASVVEAYFELNNIDINTRKYKECWIDISEFKSSILGINFLELMFKNSLDNLYIDTCKQLEFVNEDMAKLIKTIFSSTYKNNTEDTNEIVKPDIKAIFKELEKINKKVTVHYKVSGYLKQLRKEQNETKDTLLTK